jgi:5-oxoprolinase (ATP-hydrolysing) subunit A
MGFVGINCDMGEGFGPYRIGDDRALMPLIDRANLACGFHAGDPLVIWRTIRMAKEFGVGVGAHPSLPDLQGFGRREMAIGSEELTAAIVYQVGALTGFLQVEGMRLGHIKPHGALYAMAARDERIADAVAEGAAPFGVPFFGLPNTCHESVCAARGIEFVPEFFVDLDYDRAGHVIITRTHAHVDPVAAAARAMHALTAGLVRSIDGVEVAVRAQTLCIHSDTPNAPALAAALTEMLSRVRSGVAPSLPRNAPTPVRQEPELPTERQDHG